MNLYFYIGLKFIDLIGGFLQNKGTLTVATLIFMGSGDAKIKNCGAKENTALFGYGKSNGFTKEQCIYILRNMVLQFFLKEEQRNNEAGYVSLQIKVGPKAASLKEDSSVKLLLDWKRDRSSSRRTKSPVVVLKSKSPDTSDDDDFIPIFNKKKRKSSEMSNIL